MKVRILPIAALVVAAAVATASSLQAVSIKWNPKQGATYKYKMDAKMDFGQEVPISGTITNKIESVLDDKVTVSVKSSVEAMGQTQESSSTETLARNGETLESKSDADTQGVNMKRVYQSFAFIYPGNDVKEGETWVHKVKADKAKDIYSSETTFTFVGIEEVDGVKCYKITSSFRETDAPTNASATNTFWVSTEDTELYKSINNGKDLTVMEGMTMSMTATTVRIK